ncbi:hypothetical protein [Burkholderia oklahomensis]|uniref:hypothetical protein n=1 Tax=Burkholderia oklahomensis TaxID=342113 RepID=UPI000B22B867|nr:hypothetical protein [Burkholderia oklahomensis]MBI0359812.1 hypothetical protein [Burkholderia oklahomensis]QPS38631.1 hypothetical protein I6G57_07370 [Burkholderia oklahomensis]
MRFVVDIESARIARHIEFRAGRAFFRCRVDCRMSGLPSAAPERRPEYAVSRLSASTHASRADEKKACLSGQFLDADER